MPRSKQAARCNLHNNGTGVNGGAKHEVPELYPNKEDTAGKGKSLTS